jgi:hypothetical protein
MEKMTNKKALMYVVENFAEMPTDVAEKINAMITSLDKKSANRKPTKVQEQNEKLKEVILETLTDKGMTVSEVIASNKEFEGLSNQKISALLNQMAKAEEIEKVTDKKKSLFKLLPTTETIEVETDTLD